MDPCRSVGRSSTPADRTRPPRRPARFRVRRAAARFWVRACAVCLEAVRRADGSWKTGRTYCAPCAFSRQEKSGSRERSQPVASIEPRLYCMDANSMDAMQAESTHELPAVVRHRSAPRPVPHGLRTKTLAGPPRRRGLKRRPAVVAAPSSPAPLPRVTGASWSRPTRHPTTTGPREGMPGECRPW